MPQPTVDYDPNRARMALAMVSALFNGRLPPTGTDISAITGLPKVQIAWQARLNGPLANMAGQAGFGWHPVRASEIAACTFIENVIALVYGKLISPQTLSDSERATHAGRILDFLSDLDSDPNAANSESES